MDVLAVMVDRFPGEQLPDHGQVLLDAGDTREPIVAELASETGWPAPIPSTTLPRPTDSASVAAAIAAVSGGLL